jgi:hypothetical protein
MNDNNILACIEYAKENNLACADEALEDYENIKRQTWQEIEDWARSAGFVLIAERASYMKAAQQSVHLTRRHARSKRTSKQAARS